MHRETAHRDAVEVSLGHVETRVIHGHPVRGAQVELRLAHLRDEGPRGRIEHLDTAVFHRRITHIATSRQPRSTLEPTVTIER